MTGPLRKGWDSSLGRAVVVTVLGALIAAAVLLATLTKLAFSTWRPWALLSESADVLDLAKISLALVGGVGAAQALVVAYRRQRLLERDESHFVERFSAAATQLAGDRSALRLAGVYAMAALADEWVAQRQQCINVLCAYLRLPYEQELTGEDEVRMAIVDTISAHVNQYLPSGHGSWSRNNFSLKGAVFPRHVYFRNAKFDGWIDLRGARFAEGGSFNRSKWAREARFTGAEFLDNTSFKECMFGREARFDSVVFAGRVSFGEAAFKGYTTFAGAAFQMRAGFKGTLFADAVDYTKAMFSGAANFNGGVFSRAPALNGAEFANAAFFASPSLKLVGAGGNFLRGAAFFEPDLVNWHTFEPIGRPAPVTTSGRLRFFGSELSEPRLPEWDLREGESISRIELLRFFGGRRRQRISFNTNGREILLFAGTSEISNSHTDTVVFLGNSERPESTGENTANQAIREHAGSGRRLRVFMRHAGSDDVLYVGEFVYKREEYSDPISKPGFRRPSFHLERSA